MPVGQRGGVGGWMLEKPLPEVISVFRGSVVTHVQNKDPES